MSATKARVPAARAREYAELLRDLLAPACERIEIAGSLRREQPEVGDIELVAIPRIEYQAGGLFGDALEAVNRLEGLCSRLRDDVQAEHRLAARLDKNGRPRWGTRYKAAVFHTLAVDLFAVLEPAQWGVIFAIRTGSAEFSHRLVTPRREGGWLPDHFQVKDGAIRHRRDGEIVPTPEECDVFRVLGVEYVSPAARTAEARPRRVPA